MGLDSVELVLAFEGAFDISVSDDEWGRCRTPRDCMKVIERHVKATGEESGVCLSQRAFYRLRAAIIEVTGGPPDKIRRDTGLRELLPKPRGESTKAVRQCTGFSSLPSPWIWMGFTVEDWVVSAVASSPHELRDPGSGWTKPQVREVVRAAVREQLGVHRFSDDVDLVRDLGMD